MTLKEWFRKFHNRPLKIAAAFLIAIWFVFADRSYVTISEKHLSAVEQTADLLSMATRSKDRVMIESLLETLLSQGGAASAALCRGDQQVIGANQDQFGCKNATTFFDTTLERKIPGSGEIVLKARFNTLASLSPTFSILGLGLILVLAGFYFIQLAQSRIEKDILGPLLNKLLSDDNLEIAELRDLRSRVRQAQELEAQKAVTLAIQENNEQVAHDIRSPITSITALLNQADFKNADLKLALGKALQRASAVANCLLTGEREASGPKKSAIYDISEAIQDIAIEKRLVFDGGQILVDAPKYLFAESSISLNSLARILSNVIDNAILASDHIKRIEISLTRTSNSVNIKVSDKGCGIPIEIIGKLGQKGVSSRDKNQPRGSGRGVYSAKKTLSEVGGKIDFKSSPILGTTVLISVPIKPTEPIAASDLILIDNEEMIRLTWEINAENAGKTCQTFASMEEFLTIVDMVPRSTPLFVDSDLGDGKRGQEFAPLLRELGFKRIVLATAFVDLHGTTIPFIDEVVGKRFCSDDLSPRSSSQHPN